MGDPIPDSPVDWDNIDHEGISEFIGKKGSVELLAFLDQYGYRFEEIDYALNLSRGYINKRKDEALSLDLIYPSQREREGSFQRIWVLTPLGMIVAYKMGEYQVRQALRNLLAKRREYENQKSEFLDWSEDSDNIEQFVDEATDEEGVKDSLDINIRTGSFSNPFDS